MVLRSLSVTLEFGPRSEKTYASSCDAPHSATATSCTCPNGERWAALGLAGVFVVGSMQTICSCGHALIRQSAAGVMQRV